MAAIRMNEDHRNFLYQLAQERAKCPTEERADNSAYLRAVPGVRKIIEAAYPPKDMRLLAKYECARPKTCVKLQLTAGGIVEFKFRHDDDKPLMPDRYEDRGRIFSAGATESRAVSESLSAAAAFRKALDKKHGDYKALIWAASSLEQIEKVWPLGAAEVRKRAGRSLPVILSDEVIARIRADVSSHKIAA